MTLQILPVEGLPEIRPGDDLAGVILAGADLRDGDVVVVSQKVVSKAEGALVRAGEGEPVGDARRRIAREQAVAVVADTPWVLIVRTRHGLVCANAGIDASNIENGMLSLLPDDPDASARRLRERFTAAGADVAVVIADTFGRPWRVGQTDVAIGVAGMAPIRDERGGQDRQGATLEVTETVVADELAAAADLVRTKAAGVPVVIVRGFDYERSDAGRATDIVRDPSDDLFARGRGMLAAALVAPWPDDWHAGIGEDEEALIQRVAPGAVVERSGPPDRVIVDDDVTAGLAAAVLAEAGLRVRWRRQNGSLILEAGHPARHH